MSFYILEIKLERIVGLQVWHNGEQFFIVFYYVRLLCYHMAYLPLILIFIGDSPNYSEILHKYFIPTSILPNFMALYIYNFFICNLCLISFQTVPTLRSLYSKWSTISAEAPESTLQIDEVCMWDKCVLVSDLQKSHIFSCPHGVLKPFYVSLP